MEKKLPTIKEIAKRLNISVSTVSRALHDHHSIGLRTKMRVQQLAKELDYKPNQAAISFQQGKTHTIGVILPELSENFFSTAISGIEDCAHKNNYSVLLGQSHDIVEKEKQLIDAMINHRVDGILISISKNTDNYDHLEKLKDYDFPVVFFDRIPGMPNIHYVACNLVSGTVKAINFLIERGHKIIGMINGPEKLPASNERRDGYFQAMSKRKFKFDPSLIINSTLTKESIYDATHKLIFHKRKPTALVTFNDYVALDAAVYAKKHNIRINKDISLVSYANLPMSTYSEFPPLASVEQFPYLQGQKAAETLLELLNNKNVNSDTASTYFKIILESQLVIHEN
jgi:LacI family transcriptional regulator